MSLARVVPRLSTLLLACALGGCALFRPDAEAGDVPPRAAPLVQLEVDAPGRLKRLLEDNLDVGRIRAIDGADAVSETELDRLVGAAPAQVRELLETEGYFQPVVTVRREAGTPPRVFVSELPGPRVRVGRVTFDVEGELERAATAGDARAQSVIENARRAWSLQPGRPFRNEAWSDAKAAALAQLRSDGYASATWSGTGARIDVQADDARLFVVADSGPLYRSGPLVIEGLQHHDERTVRNLAGFDRGVPVTDQLLLDFQERLQLSGLFDRASVTLEAEPAQAAEAPILVRVRETSLQQAVVGLGYSVDAGPRASLEHWHRRVFGYAATARNKIEWGRDRQSWNGEVATHVKADFWRNLLGYGFEREEADGDTVTSARLRVGRGQDTPSRQKLYFVEAQSATRRTAETVDKANALSANVHNGWRRLDSQILPTDGWSLTLETAVGSANANGRAGLFSRAYARGTLYEPFGDGWFGSARLELGQVASTNAVDVPDPLRFRAGGDESVRGYGQRTLAPTKDDALVGGRALFTGSVEVARPVSRRLPSVWWAVFADAGRADESFRRLKPAVGAGAGLRWRSPVGPLKLDLAYGEETRKFRLHLNVGITF